MMYNEAWKCIISVIHGNRFLEFYLSTVQNIYKAYITLKDKLQKQKRHK